MTDVRKDPVAQRNGDSLAYTLGSIFALTPQRLQLLTQAVRSGRVSISPTPLRLPMGVAQRWIDSYRRDIADYGPEGVVKLKERLARAEQAHNHQAVVILRQKIGRVADKFAAAQEYLAAALRRQIEREEALCGWLTGCGLQPDALQTLVHSLRYNVTYVYYMPQGVMYVETN